VRDLHGRFEQQQALVGIRRVDPPTEPVAGKNLVVVPGILSAQGDLESAFAAGIAMAGPQVTARLGEHRHDVVAKRNLGVNGEGKQSRADEQQPAKHGSTIECRSRVHHR